MVSFLTSRTARSQAIPQIFKFLLSYDQLLLGIGHKRQASRTGSMSMDRPPPGKAEIISFFAITFYINLNRT